MAMKFNWRKFLRIFLISTASLVAFVIVVITLVINIFLTPSKLTPMANEALAHFVKTESAVGRVELTFISTFPRFTVQVDSLYIRQLQDSTQNLVSAGTVEVAVNPVALLSSRIVVNRVLLSDASLNLLVDDKATVMDHFLLDTMAVDTPEDTTAFTGFGGYSIDVQRLALENTNVVIDDKQKDFYARLDNFNTELRLRLSRDISNFEVVMGFDDLNVRQHGAQLVSNTSLHLDTELEFDRDSLKLSYKRGNVRLNGIEFTSSGQVSADTLYKSLNVNVSTALRTPSLAEFVHLVPSTLLDGKDELKSSGDISLNLNVVGTYSATEMPDIYATLVMNDVQARFKSRKVSVDNLDCHATAYINLNEPEKSYANLKSFNVKSSGILDLSLSASATDVLQNPSVDMTLKSDIDFNRLVELFPLQPGVTFEGKNRSDLKAQFRVQDLVNSNFGRLYVDGESVFSDLKFNLDGKQISGDQNNAAYLSADVKTGRMLFGAKVKNDDSRTLICDVKFSNLGFRDRQGTHASVDDFGFVAGANFDRRTNEVNGLGIRASIRGIEGGQGENLEVLSKLTDATLTIVPRSKGRNSRITANIKSDSMSMRNPQGDNFISLSSVGADLQLENLGPKKWSSKGSVSFDDLGMYSETFPLNITLAKTSVGVDNDKISLKNADLRVGQSRVVATGSITNLLSSMFGEKRKNLRGDMFVYSPNLHLDELIGALNVSAQSEEIAIDGAELDDQSAAENAVVASDSVLLAQAQSSALLMVPRRIGFNFDLRIDKIVMEGGTTINNVRGRAKIDRGVLSLDRLTLRTIGASAHCSMLYTNKGRRSAQAALDLRLDAVDINRLNELAPALDTLMPMLGSFEGIVDLSVVTNAKFDSKMELQLPQTKAAIGVEGKDLVLLDGETFASLSKMLMFRNKKRNLIDSMAVYALVYDSRIDVLPFKLDIDRYSAVIGGYQTVTQDFDVDYHYNVSILKSPLPFKAGVDIFGDLDDWDFKISKAKLKNMVMEEEYAKYVEFRKKVEAMKSEITNPNPKTQKK